MMQRKFVFVSILAFFLLSYCLNAESCSSSELIANAKAYDGKQIAYEGELIGAILGRGDFVWLNLYDGEAAIAIWAPKLLIKDVRYAGGYKKRGDWIRIVGILNRACLEHGGGLDIHALNLMVIHAGGVVPEALDSRKIFALYILSGAFACLLIIHILLSRRLKR